MWALFCLLLIVVSTHELLHNSSTTWWQPIVREGSSTAAATLWLIGRGRVSPSFDDYLDRPLHWIGLQLVWLPVWAAFFIPTVYWLRHAIYALLGETYHHAPWGTVVMYETLKLGLLMGLWLGILSGFDSLARFQSERERSFASQNALTEAQLVRLKAQLQPHFLFNTLNTVSSLMSTDVPQADHLLAQLGELLRASLRAGETDFTLLREELRLLKLYADIMQQRFGNRAVILWELDDGVGNAVVPSLLSQPLIENAFKHGVEPSLRQVTVRVSARRIDSQLHLTIHNTGSFLSVPDDIGTQNCRKRLQILYGDRARLEIGGDTTGVLAQVVIPYCERR